LRRLALAPLTLAPLTLAPLGVLGRADVLFATYYAFPALIASFFDAAWWFLASGPFVRRHATSMDPDVLQWLDWRF
jgi:hypothetical protein